MNLFADDATITDHNKELEIIKSQLTVETQDTYNWCRDNVMVVSAEKTKAMLVISKSKESYNNGMTGGEWLTPSRDRVCQCELRIKRWSDSEFSPFKLSYTNFHPLEVVSRYRDPQL